MAWIRVRLFFSSKVGRVLVFISPFLNRLIGEFRIRTFAFAEFAFHKLSFRGTLTAAFALVVSVRLGARGVLQVDARVLK